MKKIDFYTGMDIGAKKQVDYWQNSTQESVKNRIFDMHDYGYMKINVAQEFPIRFNPGNPLTQIDVGYNANGSDVVGGIAYDKNGERIEIFDNETWQTINYVYNGKNLIRNSGNIEVPISTGVDNYIWIEYLLTHDNSSDSETLLEGYTIIDSGTATGGAAGTLIDNTKVWVVNVYTDKYVKIVGGTGIGQSRKIVSNTVDTLTISPNWATPPDATSTYEIIDNNTLEYIRRLDGYQIKVTLAFTPPSGAGVSIYLGKVNTTGSVIDLDNRDLFGQRDETIKIVPDVANKTTIYSDGTTGTLLDHINALGAENPTPNNPHGMSLDDIPGAGLEPENITYQKETHSNGIIDDSGLNGCESQINNSVYTITNLTIPTSSLDISTLNYQTGGQDAKVLIKQLISGEEVYLAGIRISGVNNFIVPKLVDYTSISSGDAFVAFLAAVDATGVYKIILEQYYDTVALEYRALVKKITVATSLIDTQLLLGTAYWDQGAAILYNSDLLDSGTAESGTNITLTDLDKTWKTNQFQWNYITITGGTGSGQVKLIISNDSNTITIDSAWAMNPDGTSTYDIGKIDTDGTIITEHPVTNALTGGRRFGTISKEDLWENKDGDVVIDLESSIIFRKDQDDKFIFSDDGKFKILGSEVNQIGDLKIRLDIPFGWLECIGQVIDKNTDPEYTGLVDYLWGLGINYFTDTGGLPANQARLPNFKGRFPIGAGLNGAITYNVGDITADAANQSHDHTVSHVHSLTIASAAGVGNHDHGGAAAGFTSGPSPNENIQSGAGANVSSNTHTHSVNVTIVGSGAHAHSLLGNTDVSNPTSSSDFQIPPYFSVRFVIKY